MAPALGKRPRSAGGAGSGKICVHGKAQAGYFCKECPGKGICDHGRERNKCKECGGRERLRAREAANPVQGVRGRGHL
jgi:DnaJ-class molecular chaperone